MHSQHTPISSADILPLNEFEKVRAHHRTHLMEIKKNRRVMVGPDVTFYFENRETLLWQIQEMLFIEKGGDEQLKDELAAYNPLIPKGNELVATMMIEIEDMQQRRVVLSELGHIEDHIHFLFNGHRIPATPTDDDVERTTAEGKTSAVHFLHFKFTREQALDFQSATDIILSITHPKYSFETHIPLLTQNSLKIDL